MKFLFALCVFYWVERKSSSALVSWCVEPDLILWNAWGVTKAMFGSCKIFSRKKIFFGNAISGKENIFKCLVASQKMFWKIFSGVWLCSWKYHRKHIFYLLLTFSQLPNKYIISFLNIETQKKQNLEKKFIKSGQIERRRKREVRGAAIGAVRGAMLRSTRCCNRLGAAIGAMRSLLDRRSVIGSVCGRRTKSRSGACATVVVGLELGLRTRLSLSLSARESGNGLKWKFSLQTNSGSNPLKHTVNWK